jgi:hypothetical protein
MATFEPAPTYADPVLVDEHTGKPRFNPLWLRWFLKLASFVTTSGGGAGTAPDHNSLTGLQGGLAATEFYHLTATEHATLLVSTQWPMVKNSIALGEELTIPAGFQLIVSDSFDVDGTLNADGELVIL